MASVRAKALARGITIGVIDGITGGIAGKAGSAALKGGVGMASRVGRKATSLGVEMTGAAIGETAAQLVTDGHVDGFEVYAEAIGEAGAGSFNVFAPEFASLAGYKRPEYKINGQAVSSSEMIDHLNSGQLINNVEINNDVEMENRLSEVTTEQAAPFEDIRSRVVGAFRKRGYTAANEQIDDAVTDAFEDGVTAMSNNDESALSAAVNRAVDRKVSKNKAAAIDLDSERRDDSVAALSESSSDSRGAVASDLDARAARSRSAAKTSESDGQKKSLVETAENIEKEAKKIRESRKDFYRNASITNPEETKRMRELDISIERLKSELTKEGLDPKVKSDLRSTMTEMVRERFALETKVREEAKTPTQEQENQAFAEDGQRAISEIDREISDLEQTDKRMDGAKDSDAYNKRKHDDTKNRLEELKGKREKLSSLVAEYQKAKDAISDAEVQGSSAVEAATERATAIRNQIADLTGANQGITSTDVNQRVEAQVEARKSVQWFLDAVRALPISKILKGESTLLATSIDEILNSDNFAMLTAENPFAQADGEMSNAAANRRAEAWLKSRGLKYHRIAGRYDGNGESSFLVEGMTREQAAAFAKEFGQDTVAHKDGLVRGDGSINLFDGEGPTFIGEVGDNPDFMSVIRDENGDLIAFSFMPSEKYEDANGNEITSDEFTERGEAQAFETEDIETEAAKPTEKVEPKREYEGMYGPEGALPEGAVRGRVNKDGSSSMRKEDLGLSATDTKWSNRLVKWANKLGYSVIFYTNTDAAKAYNRGEWGGLCNRKTKVIHINIDQINQNIENESEQGFKRTKSFGATVSEEIFHAFLGDSVGKLAESEAGMKTIRATRKALQALVSKDKALMERVASKENQYTENYKGSKNLTESQKEAKVIEEVIVEIMSAIADGEMGDGPKVKMSVMNSFMSIVNDVVMKAFGKDSSVISLNDAKQLINIAKNFNRVMENGEFNLTEDSKVDQEMASKKLTSPYRIPTNEDGKVVVVMEETFYKYDIGFKKDIGSETITKTFNDSFHFVNWWRKVTKEGKDDHFYGFEDMNGNDINVDKIKRFNDDEMASDSLVPSGRVAEFGKRVNKAYEDGAITAPVYNRIRSKLRRIYGKLKNYEDKGFNANYVQRDIARAEMFMDKVSEVVERSAKENGVEMSSIKDEMESSALRSLFLSGDPETVSRFITEGYLSKTLLGSLTGKKPSSASITRQMLAQYASTLEGEPSQKLVGLMAGAYGRKKDREMVFGSGKDPLDFFKNYAGALRGRIQQIVDSQDLSGSTDQNIARANLIVGITSQQIKSNVNVSESLTILKEAEKNKKRRGGHEIVGPDIIKAIEKGKVKGLSYQSRSNIARNLKKVEALLAGDIDGLIQLSDLTKTGERILREQMQDASFLDADGNIDMQSLLTVLMTPYSGPGIRKHARVMSQEIFGDKIGAWILNLNSEFYPTFKNIEGTRLSDVITVDSHMFRTMSLLSPRSERIFSIERQLLKSMKKAYNKLEDANKSGKLKDYNIKGWEAIGPMIRNAILDADIDVNREAALAKAKTVISYLDKLTEAVAADEKTTKGYKDNLKKLSGEFSNPEFASDERIRRTATRAVSMGAAAMGVSPAQFGQLVFADAQTSDRISDAAIAKMIFGTNQSLDQKTGEVVTNPGFEFFEGLDDSDTRKPYITYAEVLTEDNEMASEQLKLDFPHGNTVNSEDSRLNRYRNKIEGLTVKPNMVINKEMVEEALMTDATSKRIMAKDAVVKQSQRVGVRLNLNVMKSKKVPVQTMHDKTASGEALRYAAAVMVKNPDLFVNQNARQKIVTFQENKFPMASVNGEFLSDDLGAMNFDGVKAFFNPFKHNVFVDASGRAIKSASEATIVGSVVYLRGDIEYYAFDDPILDRGRMETEEQRGKRIKRGPKYDRAVSRFEAFSKRNGIEFQSRRDLEEAYDNMPIESRVALNESEVAENMLRADEMASGMLKLRRTAGRNARRFTTVKKQILENPRNYFSPQILKDLKSDLKDMTDAELIHIMTGDGLGRLQERNDDLGVLASAEMISRAVARGELDAIPDIIAEAAAIGTTAGRLLRHFRELKSASPAGIEAIIKREVERRGNSLSSEQQARLKDMAGDLFRLQAEHEDLVRRAISGEDVDVELKNKTEEVKDAERSLDTFANGVIERGWGQIGTMLIQGNLLTPMSQITNVGANMINAIGKIGVDAIALPIERLINMFGIESPMKRNYSINAYMYGIRKFGSGFVEALDGIVTGQEKDVSEWRVHRGFAPFRSLASAMGKGDLPMGPDGKAPLSQRLKLLVQGTLGIPAEVMFRFLSLGDVPFRRGVEGIELYQAGVAQGLEGEALAQFIKHPTKRAQEAAAREGRKLTYQEQTGASKAAEDAVSFFERMFTKAFDWIPGADGRAMAKFLIRSNLPYVRTPANILIDTLTYVSPYIAGPRIMKNLQNGDAREAAQNFGKLVVGSMVSQTAVMLLKEGLISGAIEWDEDEEKNLAYDQFPPNSINVTGLQRFMSGGDATKQPDDRFISYTKLGVMGAIMGAIIKGADKEELKKRDYSGLDFPIHALQDSFGVGAFSSIAYMMDQSFMQGMNTLVDVISSADATDFEKNFENWFRTTFQAVSATALPNTLSAMYRGTREYLPDTRITKDMSLGERLVQRMAYTIKDRTFGLGDVPVRVNWKGEPIKQTPRGNNGIAYQLFDITKSRQGEADSVSNEIYRLYEQTEDLTKVVGTPGYAEKRKMNVPNIKKKHLAMISRMNKDYTWTKDNDFMAERVYLNTEQMNRLMAASGKERYKEVEAFMATEKYAKMDDEEKIEALNDIADDYNSAIEISRGQFRNHTKVLLDILQEIYDNERKED